MRIIPLLLLWSLLLASCREVTYREPQPAGVKALESMPASLLGKYIIREDDGTRKDTLLIESWGYQFKDSKDKDWLGRGALGDSLVVKFYQDYYFVNFKTDDQWALRLIRQLPNGNIQFLSIRLEGDDQGKAVIKRLSKKIKVKEIKRGDDTFYQINPTPAQLMTLIKEGFFTGDVLEKGK